MKNKLDLNGSWLFRSKDSVQWNEARVPGCVQLDLMALDKLPDPYFRMNETYFHNIEHEEWVYLRRFTWDQDLRETEHALLCFEGVDTIAEIYLNGQLLGHVEIMFIPHYFDITGLLLNGENTLEVHFDSPVKTIRARLANCPSKINSTNEMARPFVRKAQYHYGWDWGPRIVQTGIWRPVSIEIVDSARIRFPYCNTMKLDKAVASVQIGAEIEVFSDCQLKAEMELTLDGRRIVKALVEPVCSPDGKRVQWDIDIQDPSIWYPNGMGLQALYDIKITLFSGDQTLDMYAFRTGIRKVRLLQETDEEGRGFVFEINGNKIFAKGANWIPGDTLLPRLDDNYYRNYVRLAKEAGMNMLRVWGGGIFEARAFYRACDEMGIMVWQDFMYACSEYPDEYKWFQKLAGQEAEYAVKDLRKYVSIVLWCGNNECNWLFRIRWNRDNPKYLGNFLYKEILPDICARHDPSRPYWVSSPYGTDEEPSSMTEGNRHNWDVWAQWKDYSSYLEDSGRFLSEFGMQSMPCWKTVLAFTLPEDRNLLSPVMLAHNKNVDGMEKLTRYMVAKAGFPKDLKSFIYLSQFIQAEAVKLAVEHWRGRMYRTAGTLYWQLNDCWPVASWSSVDYYGRKKGLYYYIRRMYDTILPIIKYEENQITLYCINERLEEKTGEAVLRAYGLDGCFKAEKRVAVRLLPGRSSRVAAYFPSELGIGDSEVIQPIPYSSNTIPVAKNGDLLNTVVFAELNIEGTPYRNYYLFDNYRNLPLVKPDIQVSIEAETILLRSETPAFGVFLETEEDTDLSDNCLVLEPGRPYAIICDRYPGSLEISDLTGMTRILE